MRNKTAFKTIRDYLYPEKEKVFVIPNYQRGYKWATKEGENQSAVEKLCDDLNNANKEQEYFLQGVTVTEDDSNVMLIDGQQRTTTLYLLLWYFEALNNLKLTYNIREASKRFINNLSKINFESYKNSKPESDCSQDIYYFDQAIRQIDKKLNGVKGVEEEKTKFVNFLLNKVTILYIVIDSEKATKTFTMMNGSKATMLQEELVKAEMLRRVSLPERVDKQVSTSIDENLAELKEIISTDWETNSLRSRYAREWDKWLYWWNRYDVQEYFGCNNPLGYLLKFYLSIEKKKSTGERKLFDIYRDLLYDKKQKQKEKQTTKLIFKELRDLQKSFEDIYNTPKVYNYLKMALICSINDDDKYNIIKYFIEHKSEVQEKLYTYTNWRLVGATHIEITQPEKSTSETTKEARALDVFESISKPFVYNDKEAKKHSFIQLLRLNVKQDNNLGERKNSEFEGRKFDFSIWNNKSLEHIHPKSKVYYINEDKKYIRGDEVLITPEEKWKVVSTLVCLSY